MRVLIACEFSGIVRDAFAARGHFAVSCDLLPSETSGPHIEGNVLEHLRGEESENRNYDLLIAHPPCTYLCNSGVRWLYGGSGRTKDPVRWSDMLQACAFFLSLLNCGIPRICVENPIPHRHAELPRYSQIIQPWQFGHPETKATALWLRNLPPLVPTDIVDGRTPRVHHASPGPDRWKERSRTLKGIAEAMATQWNFA